MTKININGIPKEKVILALFKNVYEKSDEAKQDKINIMKFTPNEPGIYSEPYDFEISEILRHNGRIDYLGCVKFSMDFSADIIDTDLYDRLHKTGKNGIESAMDVIEKLRSKKELKDDLKFSDKITKPLFSYSSYSFTDSMKKQSIAKSDNKGAAEEKLTTLLGKPIRLMHLYSDNYCFEFSSEQSYEVLKKDMALLASKGISVTAIPPASLCGGLVKTAAQLEFKGPLSDITAKLGPIASSVTVSPTTLSPV